MLPPSRKRQLLAAFARTLQVSPHRPPHTSLTSRRQQIPARAHCLTSNMTCKQHYLEYTQSYEKLATSTMNTQQYAFNHLSRLHARIWPQPTRLSVPAVSGECKNRSGRKATSGSQSKSFGRKCYDETKTGCRTGRARTDCA